MSRLNESIREALVSARQLGMENWNNACMSARQKDLMVCLNKYKLEWKCAFDQVLVLFDAGEKLEQIIQCLEELKIIERQTGCFDSPLCNLIRMLVNVQELQK